MSSFVPSEICKVDVDFQRRSSWFGWAPEVLPFVREMGPVLSLDLPMATYRNEYTILISAHRHSFIGLPLEEFLNSFGHWMPYPLRRLRSSSTFLTMIRWLRAVQIGPVLPGFLSLVILRAANRIRDYLSSDLRAALNPISIMRLDGEIQSRMIQMTMRSMSPSPPPTFLKRGVRGVMDRCVFSVHAQSLD